MTRARIGRAARLGLAAGLAMLACGCAVGPEFRRPPSPEPARYTSPRDDAPDAAVDASAIAAQRLVRGQDIPADWWTLFRCEPLDALVDEALARSPTVAAARATLRAARENVAAQRGASLPTVDAQFGVTRQSVANSIASPLASNSDLFTLHTAQLDVGYVADVFGANRRQVESLQAEADLQRFELEAARLSVSSNLVAAVIQHASLREQIRTTRAIVAASGRLLELYKRGRALGQINGVDLALQEGLAAQALAALPPLDKQLIAQTDQIALLLGKVPGEFVAPAIDLAALHLPDELPLSLPSRLVEQRPDVRAAEETLHSASALIGVAIANRLPAVTLTATAGTSDPRFARLFGAGTAFWSVGGGLVQPLFDANTLLHRQRAAEASYEQALAQYRSTVLVAFQNVADALGAIAVDTEALRASTRAERAALKSLEIARRQQAAGLTGALPAVSAEQARQQAALGRVQAEADRLADSAALLQALGGGWWNRDAAASR